MLNALFLNVANKESIRSLGRNFGGIHLRKVSTSNCKFHSYGRSMSSVLTEDKVPTFCLNDYDVIGFDLDHTICKYKIKAISQLVYRNMCTYLVTQKRYPSNIFGSYEESARFYQRGVVIDMQKGNFLKLADDFTILRATHGTRLMTSTEVERLYGPKKIWEPTKNMLHELCENKGQARHFRCLQDFFVIPAPYIGAKLIDYFDAQTKELPDVYTFWLDIYESIADMYNRECFKEMKGGYFTALKENLPAFVEKCPQEMLTWLKSLKNNKKLFLLTGSHSDYAKFILDYVMGENWPEYFDICVTYARKPRFFYETKENQPFLQLDGFSETSPISGEELQRNCVYSQGNWTEIKLFFTKICNNPNVKCLYFGDVIMDDVYAGSRYSCCDTVSILEEMAAEGIVGFEPDEELVDEMTSFLWGSFFIDSESKPAKKPFWISTVLKYGRLAIPNLKAMSSMSLTDRVPTGFYPSMPVVYASNKLNSKI